MGKSEARIITKEFVNYLDIIAPKEARLLRVGEPAYIGNNVLINGLWCRQLRQNVHIIAAPIALVNRMRLAEVN